MAISVQITVNNWSTYNPKRDQQTYSWLRLQNNLGQDPKLFGLSAAQKYVWVLILCQCSIDNSGTTTIYLDALAHQAQVPRAEVEELIDFLSERNVIETSDGVRPRTKAAAATTARRPRTTAGDRARTKTTPTNERTDERTNETKRDVRNETNERTNEKAEDIPSAPSGCSGERADEPLRPPVTLAAGGDEHSRSREFIARYCDLWRKRYRIEKSPPISGKAAGAARRLITDHGFAKAVYLLDAFMAMPEGAYLNRRHDLALLQGDVIKVAHFAETRRVVSQRELRQIDDRVQTDNLLADIRENGV